MEEGQFWKEMMIMLAFLGCMTLFIYVLQLIFINLWGFLQWLWIKR
jgi:hypothetical protein